MKTKLVTTLVSASVLVLLVGVFASAQVGQLRGLVSLKQADGTLVPVAGAQVDVYRVDLPGHFPNKTDKKGNFVYAGLPLTGNYILAFSAPGAAPYVLPGVRVGGEKDIPITLEPGSGATITEAEARASAKSAGPADVPGKPESAAEKAKREALIKENEKIKSLNEKNKTINETVNRTFKTGNDAMKAKKYDEAIAAYDEGLAADPDQNALWANRARALVARGVDRYNSGQKDAGKEDMKAGAESATKAVEVIKTLPVPTDPAELTRYNANKLASYTVYIDAMRLYVTNVDQSKAPEGAKAFDDYIAMQPDPTAKADAEARKGKMLFESGNLDAALEVYKKILGERPDDPDALVYMGLILFNKGAISNDQAQFQEAANYLQQFYDHAPDTHPLKKDAKDVLDNMKVNQNIKAQKPATTTRRRG